MHGTLPFKTESLPSPVKARNQLRPIIHHCVFSLPLTALVFLIVDGNVHVISFAIIVMITARFSTSYVGIEYVHRNTLIKSWRYNCSHRFGLRLRLLSGHFVTPSLALGGGNGKLVNKVHAIFCSPLFFFFRIGSMC